jgi:hypothetical protein
VSGRCPCGAKHDEAAFRTLQSVRVIDGEALRAIVSRWPEGTIVDVRRCNACGRALARLVRSSFGVVDDSA